MIVIGMKIMDNSKARQVGRERTPEGSHLGKFTQYSQRYPTQPTLEKKFKNTWAMEYIVLEKTQIIQLLGEKSTDIEKLVFLVDTI